MKERIKPYPKNENSDMSVRYERDYLCNFNGCKTTYIIPKEWNIYGDEEIVVNRNSLKGVLSSLGVSVS